MGGQERIVKRHILGSVSRCQACHQTYDQSCIQIVSHDEDFWLAMIVCPRCRNRGLIAAVIKEGVPTARQPLTDLTESDRDRFRHAAPISPDDVLSVHDLLTHFDGNFSDLFTHRS